MTTPPPLSIKDLSDSQHGPLEKCPVPRVPPSDHGAGRCRGSFPPYQKWIPITAGDKSFVHRRGSIPRRTQADRAVPCPVPRSGSVPSHVPSQCALADAPSSLPHQRRTPILARFEGAIQSPAHGRVHAPKLHFTRGSSNPIARFGLGVETKSEFPTLLAPRLGSLEKALRRSRDQRTAEQAEPDARETVRAFDVCSLQCPRFTNKLHCERKSLI